ncbi:MAG: ABC transporter permease [Terracidiphilus sp.]|jgi:putative ABC transport system permease protein
MRALRAFLVRLRGIFNSHRTDADFTAELESHVAFHTDEGIHAGLTPEEARRQALIRLGGAEQTRQAHRERRTFPMLESVLKDAHYGLRSMVHNPGFTAVTVLTLAIGIGASTAIFSAIKPILIDPLPYPHASRLMMLWEMRKNGAPMAVTFGTFHGLTQQNHSFESLAVFKPWRPADTATSQADRPERFEGQRVSADYFRTFGVAPFFGRDFQALDDRFRGPNVVILSDLLWHRRYAADRAIVGKQVRLDDALYTVIGVMPSSFDNVVSPTAEIWAPLQYDPSLPFNGREWGHHLHLIGRLKAGVSSQQAVNDLSVTLHALAQTYAKGYDSSGGAPNSIVVHPLQGDLTQGVRPALLAVLGAVMLVLLIACVNVANLLLARGSQRSAEFAMRVALGAHHGRLARQLLTESLILATAGGALGMAVAEAGTRALLALSPPGLPRLNAIAVSGGVFLFAFALTTFIGIAVGLVSTFQASRPDLHTGMRQNTGRTTASRHWARRTLVVTEVSLAVVLLVSAGLLLRSMQRFLAVDPGFDASHLLTMQVQESGHRYDSDSARLQFFQQSLDNIRRIPGVASAGLTSQLPLSGDQDVYGIQFEKDNNPLGEAGFRYAVSPGYLETMRIPLRRGRLLNEHDVSGAPVAVLITQSLASKEFAGQDPIGQHVRVGLDVGQTDRPWATIVGVVGNVKQESLAIGEEDAYYITTAQWAWADQVQSVVVRTQAQTNAASLAPAVQEAFWSVDKDRPITRVATMDSLLAATAQERHFVLVLFEAFGLVALLLAAIGIYGILSGSVTERTRELGVRAALGATRTGLLALVLRQGMTTTCIGLAIGLCGALAAGRALNSMLFGVTWLDRITYLGATVLLFVVSGVACLIPARRAASVDPMQALRTE